VATARQPAAHPQTEAAAKRTIDTDILRLAGTVGLREMSAALRRQELPPAQSGRRIARTVTGSLAIGKSKCQAPRDSQWRAGWPWLRRFQK
jgi:hypothetical protein